MQQRVVVFVAEYVQCRVIFVTGFVRCPGVRVTAAAAAKAAQNVSPRSTGLLPFLLLFCPIKNTKAMSPAQQCHVMSHTDIYEENTP